MQARFRNVDHYLIQILNAYFCEPKASDNRLSGSDQELRRLKEFDADHKQSMQETQSQYSETIDFLRDRGPAIKKKEVGNNECQDFDYEATSQMVRLQQLVKIIVEQVAEEPLFEGYWNQIQANMFNIRSISEALSTLKNNSGHQNITLYRLQVTQNRFNLFVYLMTMKQILDGVSVVVVDQNRQNNAGGL